MTHNIKDKIIQSALPHIAEEGWTLAALARGAKDAGVASKDMEQTLFSAFHNTISEALSHYSDLLDRQMTTETALLDFEAMKIRERIATLIMTRIRLMSSHKEAARRAAATLALPRNMRLGAKLLYKTVNQMWYLAGDRSTDFNFYSKRTLLSGVYTSTFLYWLKDPSPDFTETRLFLDRRIADIMRIPKAKMMIKSLREVAFGPIKRFMGHQSPPS